MKRWLITTAVVIGALAGLVWTVGALLPERHVASTRAAYAQPPDSIFSAIVDVAAHPEWRSGISSVDILSRDPLRWRETGEYGVLTFRVEDMAPPSRFAARIDDPSQPFGGRWTWRVESDGQGGSIVQITEDGEIYSPLFRFFARFVFGYHGTQEAYLRALGERFGERTDVERVDGTGAVQATEATSELDARVFGSSAVITGHPPMRDRAGGQAFDIVLRSMDVRVRGPGGSRLAAAHLVPGDGGP